MKCCEKCKVNVVGKRENCPLCQGPLLGTDEEQEEEFPQITSIYKRYNMFFKIMILVSIITATVTVTINIAIPYTGAWSLFVIAGFICVWVSLITAINKRNNIPKNIIYQVMIVSILVVCWDYLTGWKGWSIDYVIPCVCIFAMAAMSIITKLMRLHIEDYMLYMIIDGVFGIVPIIFIVTGILKVVYPSLICFAISVISLSSILVFEGESMRSEIDRRLHL